MTTYKIEKNVPLPAGGLNARKYPFGDMEIGDSLFVTERTNSFRNAATAYGRAHGIKLISATVDGGVRVWRIADKAS